VLKLGGPFGYAQKFPGSASGEFFRIVAQHLPGHSVGNARGKRPVRPINRRVRQVLALTGQRFAF